MSLITGLTQARNFTTLPGTQMSCMPGMTIVFFFSVDPENTFKKGESNICEPVTTYKCIYFTDVENGDLLVSVQKVTCTEMRNGDDFRSATGED
jgi:hypothetical protein